MKHLLTMRFALRPEAAMALRRRLNETVDELAKLKETHTALDVKYDSQTNELTIAKSDCACRFAL